MAYASTSQTPQPEGAWQWRREDPSVPRMGYQTPQEGMQSPRMMHYTPQMIAHLHAEHAKKLKKRSKHGIRNLFMSPRTQPQPSTSAYSEQQSQSNYTWGSPQSPPHQYAMPPGSMQGGYNPAMAYSPVPGQRSPSLASPMAGPSAFGSNLVSPVPGHAELPATVHPGIKANLATTRSYNQNSVRPGALSQPQADMFPNLQSQGGCASYDNWSVARGAAADQAFTATKWPSGF